MKTLFTLAIISCFCFFLNPAEAQTFQYGMNPNDPDVVFTSSNQPALPAWNNYGIVKWGHTNRLGWGPYAKGYRSYLYQGMAFRVKFPKTYQHGVADGKKYPMLIFFHGRGEAGSVYDNEYQLLHGGELHANKVNDGTFDGFLFYAQSTTGNSQDYFPRISALIDSMVKSVKVDIDRVMVSGLSSGGQATWDFLMTDAYAKKICTALPLCAASTNYPNYMNTYITIPLWTSNGGQDAAPAPFTVTYVVNEFRNRGGLIRQTFYPNLGHGIWNQFWSEPDYFPYLSKHHKANPLVYFQRNEFCPNDPVSARMALHAGFNAYQWEKDGVIIPGATSNEYTATSYGTYRARFRRVSGGDWSEWSPTPVVVGAKPGTVSPPIQVDGLFSHVVPAPDGSTTVPLAIPEGYASYEWRRVSDNAVVSTTNKYTAAVGSYKVMVTEEFGCSSNFSVPFEVVNANGTNLPDKVSNLSASAPSSSSIQLDWNDNPNPINNETAFEIYRSETSGSGYRYVGKVGANVLTFLDENLPSNKRFYYIVRAINATGASPLSTEVSTVTMSDVTPPTAPSFLRVVSTTGSTVKLAWDVSTDDVGVAKYDVYVNGLKSYVTTNNEDFTVSNLNYQETYSFYVKARDLSNNESPASNQVNATAALSGLSYKYYEGSWSALPDFNTLTPVATGIVPNVSITPRLRNDQFGFLWEGYIKVPQTATYMFETNSDDGSKLYIGAYDHNATPLVNNDGLHGTQYRSGTITLTAGIHPIAMTFFEQGGGEAMNVFWRSATVPGMTGRTQIPNSAFTENVTIPVSSLPNAPTNLVATGVSYNRINLTWTDNSNNETGFEVLRSVNEFGPFLPIGLANANATSFADTINIAPSTSYWYKLRSVNNFGGSVQEGHKEVNWGFNNNLNDAAGSSRTLTNSNTSFVTDRKEGSHAISFNGTNAYADMTFSNVGNFPSDAYRSRTVALWIKPNASTISASNKVFVDLGGSDQGMALRFNNGALEAAICRNSSFQSASVSNVTSNASWTAGGWNHVAAVYDGSTIKIFINGVQRASTNLSNSGTGVAASTGLSRLGSSNGSHAFRTSSSGNNYGGLMDDIFILPNALTAASIAKLMNDTYVTAATSALPPAPAAPSALNANAVSTSQVNLAWADNSNNENNFELFRSVGNTNSYRMLATLPAGTTSYQDMNLFANTTYYYQVRAAGTGGKSAFSATASAQTGNTAPVMEQVSNFAMRHSSTKTVNFTATDADGEALTMTIQNMPAFGSFTPGNGTASLVLNPSAAQTGDYTVTVRATDGHTGQASTTFTITVNSNYVPLISAVSNASVNEGATQNINLTATDQDGNGSLVWSLVSATPWAQFTGTSNGVGTLKLSPGYADAGVHDVVAKVIDGAGGEAQVTFTVTVNNVEPSSESVYMNMRYNGPNAPAPWNNINGTNTSNLLNSNGQATSIGLQFTGTAWNAGEAGAVTGNNSGIYPDAVIRDYFWFGIFGAPETVPVNITGLDPAGSYNVTLFASSSWAAYADNGTTVYTLNGVSKSIHVQANSTETVTFSNITPNASGIISFTMSKAAGTPYGVLTSIVLQKPFTDATTPMLPGIIAATALEEGGIRVNWKDIAYNEDRYLVHRATSPAGPFTVINPGASNANDTVYVDNGTASGVTYYYKLEAVNANGSSGLTAAVSATANNRAPQLAEIGNRVMNGGTSTTITIAPVDDPSNTITTTVAGLPTFATFQNNGNGQGVINLNPSLDDVGEYRNVTVTTTDNLGGSVTRTFNIRVINPALRSVYVNFGSPGSTPAPEPWNNFLSFPYANFPLSNLKDDANTSTTFGVRLLAQWNGTFEYGMITGSDKGIFPDAVISGSLFSTGSSDRVVQVEGLNPGRKYNIAVFTSHNAGTNSDLTITSGSQSVTLNGTYNSNKSAQLNGLVPNGSGVIQITLSKPSATNYINLNAMVIEEYAGTPMINPYYLFAESDLVTDRIKLKWADRSNNETGFQIYRSTSPTTGYSLVTTTGAGVTTYNDNGVSPNTRYFYKVRAVNAGGQSGFSNVATQILAPRIVFVNFNANAAGNGPTPWNNTNGPSIEGATFSDLKDQTNANSGIELVITKEFNGPGFAGVTGAGIFPSAVMESNYWTDAGQLSQVKFSNLNITKKYRVGVFGSAIFQGYSIARYTCNGQQVYLNSLYNNSKVVYLENLQPNDDGELVIDVNTQAGSPYSFTGAWTIESFDDNSDYTPVIGRGDANDYVDIVPAAPAATAKLEVKETPIGDVKVYPNPFTRSIQVEWNDIKASQVSVLLYDINGRMVFKGNKTNTVAGKNLITVNVDGNLTPGTYVLNILADGKLERSVKLVKVK